MLNRKTPDLAKHEAITTVFGLTFSAFVVALSIAFGLPFLLSSVLSSSTTDPTKTIVTVLTSLSTSFFFMWFSAERIKTTVGLAIDAAINHKSKEYKELHPDIQERLRIQLQEYVCTIPLTHRSESSVRLSSPSPVICNRRIGRDAVIRSLSYDDHLLQGIALAAVDETLAKVHGGNPSEEIRELFLTDVYAYLKAWLMLSITHSHIMPVEYIQQRYPTTHRPNKKAYVMALEIIKNKSIKSDAVLKSMSKVLKDEHSMNQATNLLDEYLEILVNEINTSKNRRI